MKLRHFVTTILLASSLAGMAKTYTVASPDGKIAVDVDVDKQITYSISLDGSPVLTDGVISLTLNGKTLGENPKVNSVSRKSVSDKINPVVAFKFSEIDNTYEQMLLKFAGKYSVEFRAFNDGVAYRVITDMKGKVEVDNEVFSVALPENYKLHGQLAGGFKTSYEERYQHLSPEQWNNSGDKFTELPILVELDGNRKVLISESALTDYPAMFLNPLGTTDRLNSIFPKVPLKFGPDGDRSVKILEEADYIAKTDGKRAFPWRYFVVTSEDGQIIENTMTARLAEKSVIADPSWIKPGTTTWEWWNGATPYGPDVDFVAGCNTPTYKYFIDFASKYGVNYVLLDEGWAKSTRNPFDPNDELDLAELIKYGKSKNVGIILWLTWLTVENNFDLFEKYAEMGVDGVKIDFMDRSDQWMVNYYERVAEEAAKHGLFVDFHGSFKPAGLEYKYPNVLSYEGVRGMEQMGGCTPDNSVYLPYLRNAVGPMDYTPGAMLNYQPEKYRCDRPNSGSQGTRAYQMALYILWETGLQMLADNPTLYMANDDCTRFIAGVPVTTDETKALAAKAGEYTIAAKKKGDKWYVGGITNNDKQWREFDITLDFLGDGEYTLTSFEDGVNAPTQAMHYVKNSRKVKKGDTVKVKMARNGGYAAIIE
ncbi:MAG: glycoside hydrolase family 97 protein [Bacteroidales bacterium]|nr:glycoside hydrolase family 97 protein [Bacteroidales bacterium]